MHEFLVEISKKMKEEGYVPDTNFVLHDVEEEQKEQNLSYHSEMLAVAFGIIATTPETIIKVFKNLRTCVDCHTAIKFISKMLSNKFTVSSALAAASVIQCLQLGKEIHGCITGTGLDSDEVVWSALCLYLICTQPDHIVFTGVLSACTHAGLVDKGLEYFRSIKWGVMGACDGAVTENCPDKHEQKQYFRLVMNERVFLRENVTNNHHMSKLHSRNGGID
ncbi:hypothetical protein EZV62_005991 [Acer yangbiense]|uniref:DYW domain-containing protein n=1 Tax=Acer yangbiense TaxID=1000413 RepID=A0A5C7IRI2_9ROSI|nr:hypothetical protein EZV62_005991 [Acer yangbiense]